MTLNGGWWRGRMGFLGERAHTTVIGWRSSGSWVTTDDGAVHVLATDESWRARDRDSGGRHLRRADHGPRFDSARLFDHAVEIIEADLKVLVGEDGPPMRVNETIPAQRVLAFPSGKRLIDFGQNTSSAQDPRLHVPSATSRTRSSCGAPRCSTPASSAMSRFAAPRRRIRTSWWGPETRCSNRHSPSTDSATPRSPASTRWAEDIEAIVIGNDLTRTGWFESSDAMLNQLHRNVVWGMRETSSTFHRLPQRDASGEQGDIQVFSPTATYLFDTGGFLTSWLADLAAEQDSAGQVPHVVPDILRSELTSIPTAAWGDAATVVPWVLWERTGDRGILERQFGEHARMGRPCHLCRGRRSDLASVQYGDWLDPTAPRGRPLPGEVRFGCRRDSALRPISRHRRPSWRDLERRGCRTVLRPPPGRTHPRRVQREFVAPPAVSCPTLRPSTPWRWSGTCCRTRVRAPLPASGSRTSCAQAVSIATGFVRTPLICDALTNAGFPDVAVRLLLQTQSPSWLYPITVGATTIWERWDSLLADGTINANGMTSFNHYALGSVVDWVHRRIAELTPAAPGYRTISVRPIFPTTLDHCTARHRTPYGDASVSWSRANGVIRARGGGRSAPVPRSASRFEVRSVGHGRHRWEIVEQPAATRPIAFSSLSG